MQLQHSIFLFFFCSTRFLFCLLLFPHTITLMYSFLFFSLLFSIQLHLSVSHFLLHFHVYFIYIFPYNCTIFFSHSAFFFSIQLHHSIHLFSYSLFIFCRLLLYHISFVIPSSVFILYYYTVSFFFQVLRMVYVDMRPLTCGQEEQMANDE